MSDTLKAAFIFITPDANPEQHQGWVSTPGVAVKTLAVSSYQQACDILPSLTEEGITAIELCGGFGHQGVAQVTRAAAGRMHVGVVRFDQHPLLNFCSGDSLTAA
ncbi:DUF6506 family protein [Aliamphritea hakodatensis]|uniref:DUF6506 family protein n=1 Tax=Aliamphritea hakodatensis TaxID=2895352 RepID=UPI0022FDA125|nr:DUF6506 family protein [Aliamphritea hakodatensis]